MVENDHGHFVEMQLPRGEEAAVAGDDASTGVHQDRIIKTELCDAGSYLRNLRVGVGPWIAGVGNEFVEWPVFDVLRHRVSGHKAFAASHQLIDHYQWTMFEIKSVSEITLVVDVAGIRVKHGWARTDVNRSRACWSGHGRSITSGSCEAEWEVGSGNWELGTVFRKLQLAALGNERTPRRPGPPRTGPVNSLAGSLLRYVVTPCDITNPRVGGSSVSCFWRGACPASLRFSTTPRR